MKKNLNMKIFDNNLSKNPKTVILKKKVGDIGKTKYLPSFTKEWKNIIYSYNKNMLKNIPMNDQNERFPRLKVFRYPTFTGS